EGVGVEAVDRAYRLLRRRLEGDNSWRYGSSRIHRLLSKYRGIMDHVSVDGMKVIDFGCGPHNPLALGVALYLNGARESISVDLRSVADARRSAIALYDLLAECLVLPELWHWKKVKKSEFVRRAHSFDRRSLK